jgi:ABC-2 type transport system permease protein
MLGLMVFFAMAGIALPIGAIIMGQEEVLDEKRSGTAAWILSKPVSRSAFILSKVTANAIGILLIMVLLQGALAYGLIAIVTGTVLPVLPFLGALGVLYVAVMFYFLIALMFSAVSNSRGTAIGLPMAILLGYQFVVGVAPWTLEITPWGLTNAGSGNGLANSVATALAMGHSFSVLPIVATLAWCVLFVVVAVWKFNRDEF